ncbi:uncharacterized protein LOC130984959 isoform X2 [Salvia miltiorrhiza]|uniref:uncharacterized protein LOC130984959 isoform X2 n=1 Tax=Salvia miltiorrhiza TaxID=226208 RepID=UPI0025ABFF5E|nr:uncharacterized protein LOC130984959 isoform X2 [Salvia miltiorrhiza]
MEKFQQFLNAAQTGNLDLLKKLAKQLDSGMGLAQTVVDVKDANQRGALHFAAREGQTEVCKYLLEELKMDINTKDEDGDTPLTHAARQGHTALTKYLVDHAADPSIPSGLGTTALHHSAGRGNKRRRIKEKEESVERGRTKFREEEIPLTMDMGERTCWTDNDKSVFNSLLRDFRMGELDAEFPNGTFADDGTVNYSKEEFWRALCRLYNNRAAAANASQREPYEMILQGELLRGEIFPPCAACQRIPVFPTSLLKKLAYESYDQSGSGASASAASVTGTGGMFDTELVQVINIVSSMEKRGLISMVEMSKTFDLVNEWV